jgi:hypothetical protein
MANAEQIMQVKYELGDLDVAFPFLSDSEYSYFIDKNDGNIRRSMLDCAKTILFKLSMRGDETVDIFSFKGARAAAEYREALKMFIKNPAFNPALTLASIFAGGTSVSDMQANLEDEDANAVTTPLSPKQPLPTNYFEI